MKIWITYRSVNQLISGGLERCDVWFQKPRYKFFDRTIDVTDLPFGGGTQYEGVCKLGWEYSMTDGKETRSVSLGKIFNYKGSICNYVWLKLCEHFESDDLRNWDLQAKKLNLYPKDFILELDVCFEMKAL
jgi:hypothetical protein